MSKILLDVDPAIEADIMAAQKRDFELTLTFAQNLTGQNYILQVRDTGGNEIVSFLLNKGISLSANTLTITGSSTKMNIPSGTFSYDLLEIKNNRFQNLYKGWFIVEPSVTQIPSNTSFPYTLPFNLN